MRRIIFWFVIMSIANFGIGQTPMPEGIIGGENWRISGSPYLINVNILVASLTIHPGVAVLLNV